MNKLKRVFATAAVLAMALAGNSALAATACNGPLSGTIVGGVVVNAGAPCILAGANVSGGVQVTSGGILIVCGSIINGGVVANGAAEIIFGAEEIDCAGDVVNGGVQISNTGTGAFPPAPSIALERSTFNGAIRLTGNLGPIAIATNRIAGALFCSRNAFNPEDEGSPSIITGGTNCVFGEGE
jgi:hypothetical protein